MSFVKRECQLDPCNLRVPRKVINGLLPLLAAAGALTGRGTWRASVPCLAAGRALLRWDSALRPLGRLFASVVKAVVKKVPDPFPASPLRAGQDTLGLACCTVGSANSTRQRPASAGCGLEMYSMLS
jgi:hypothetical protein